MKTKPTEALRYILTCIEPNVDTAMSTITRADAGIAAKIAFKEGQSNPKIKQLEWGKSEIWDDKIIAVSPLFEWYEIDIANNSLLIDRVTFTFKTVDECKKFAQDDFEMRIKECLIIE